MKPRFEMRVVPPDGAPARGAPAQTAGHQGNGHLAAICAERIHSILRRMPGEDWTTLKELLHERLTHPSKTRDIDLLERMFRTGEPLGGQAGGTVLQMVEAITGHQPLLQQVQKANERMRERVRFVLREMSAPQWQAFRSALVRSLPGPTNTDDLGVLHLVCRIGESVSNVETAALALADRLSGRKLIQPEVARRNAMVKVLPPGTVRPDPEAAYLAAQRAIAKTAETTARAEHTLAFGYVEPTMPYKHARNTVFRIVDAILDEPALMAEVATIEQDLLAVKPVSREQMRWALHRMPLSERMEVIKLIPLNTILMFQDGEANTGMESVSFPANDSAPAVELGGDAAAMLRAVALKAARDRRLAYDFFVKGQSDEQLTANYGLSVNAVKNELGVVLQALIARPSARKHVLAYLARVQGLPPMASDEVRRRMKQLPSDRQAQLLNALPNCAWKIRQAIPVHKHLFLDYLSGEWVLAALVDYYNLEKTKRLSGQFSFAGTLTARGANAAIAGLLRKIAEEPELRQRLRLWTSGKPEAEAKPDDAAMGASEPTVDELLPPQPATGTRRAALTALAEPLPRIPHFGNTPVLA